MQHISFERVTNDMSDTGILYQDYRYLLKRAVCNERISSLRIFRQQHFNERGLTGEGQNALTRRAFLFTYIETCHRLCLCVQFSL